MLCRAEVQRADHTACRSRAARKPCAWLPATARSPACPHPTVADDWGVSGQGGGVGPRVHRSRTLDSLLPCKRGAPPAHTSLICPLAPATFYCACPPALQTTCAAWMRHLMRLPAAAATATAQVGGSRRSTTPYVAAAGAAAGVAAAVTALPRLPCLACTAAAALLCAFCSCPESTAGPATEPALAATCPRSGGSRPALAAAGAGARGRAPPAHGAAGAERPAGACFRPHSPPDRRQVRGAGRGVGVERRRGEAGRMFGFATAAANLCCCRPHPFFSPTPLCCLPTCAASPRCLPAAPTPAVAWGCAARGPSARATSCTGKWLPAFFACPNYFPRRFSCGDGTAGCASTHGAPARATSCTGKPCCACAFPASSRSVCRSVVVRGRVPAGMQARTSAARCRMRAWDLVQRATSRRAGLKAAQAGRCASRMGGGPLSAAGPRG